MDLCGEAVCRCMFLCLAVVRASSWFAQEKDPNSRWSNELFTLLFWHSMCFFISYLLCLLCSGCSDQLSNICLPKKKKKSFASLVGRLCYFSYRKFTSSCRNGRRRGANSNSYWLITDVCSTGWKITPLPMAMMDRALALSCFLGSSAGHLCLAAVDVTWAFPLTARQWAWTRSLLPVTSLLLLLLPPAFLQQQTAISEWLFPLFLLFSFFMWADLNWCTFLEKNRS